MLNEFKKLVGDEIYSSNLDTLQVIGPDALADRISVVLAGMLRYALDFVFEDVKDTKLGSALIALDEDASLGQGDSPQSQPIVQLVELICKEVGMKNAAADGEENTHPTIAALTVAQYANWYIQN